MDDNWDFYDLLDDNIYRNSRLIKYVLDNDIYSIRKLFENANKKNIKDFLNYQNRNGDTAIMIAIRNNADEEINYLLNFEEIDLNLQNVDEESALSLAISNNNFELVKKLINKGANINLEGYYGRTPLMLAIYLDSINIDIIKLLILSGAKLTLVDRNYETAEDYFNTYRYNEDIDVDFRTFVNELRFERNLSIYGLEKRGDIVNKPRKNITSYLDGNGSCKKHKRNLRNLKI